MKKKVLTILMASTMAFAAVPAMAAETTPTPTETTTSSVTDDSTAIDTTVGVVEGKIDTTAADTTTTTETTTTTTVTPEVTTTTTTTATPVTTAATSGTTVKAVVTPQTVTVDAKQTAFQAYNINGYNYFKLRDIAAALNSTGSTFSVGYDVENNAVSLTTGENYVATGGELAVSEDKADKSAVASTSTVVINGRAVKLESYNIDGYNYFKLRDLGENLNFGVDWNAAASTVAITSVTVDATTPAEGTTTPAEGTTTPAEGTATPAEGTTTPAEGTTTEGTTIKDPEIIGSITNEEGTVAE